MLISPWFKLYGDMVDDPKIAGLPDKAFRLWIEMLCVQCLHGTDEGNTGMNVKQFLWRTRKNDIENELNLLCSMNLVSLEQSVINIPAWLKRQHRSSSALTSTERSRKYRENKRNVAGNDDATLQATHGNTRVRASRANPAREQSREEQNRAEKTQKNPRGQAAPFVFQIPFELDTPEFRKAWEERTAAIKSKVNSAGLAAQLKRCVGMGYDRALATVRHSLTYQGLVEPPSGKNGPVSHLRPEERPDPKSDYSSARACQQCGAREDSPLKSNPEFDVSLTRHNGELICSDCYAKTKGKQAVP